METETTKRTAGRKPINPKLKKVTVPIYPQQYIVDYFGGLENLQNWITDTIKLQGIPEPTQTI